MKPGPRLLYHNTTPTVYPEGDSSDNVLVVRFSTPVRISSIRITPEGVGTLNGGLGCTYPTRFNARLCLHTSPSDPVNALTSSSITFDGRKGWEQDYEIGMPEGVGTRLMILSGGFERVSISVYGFTTTSDDQVEAIQESVEQAQAQAKVMSVESEKQDWAWISDWAGGPNGLMDLLDDHITDEEVRNKALKCLELLVEIDPLLLDEISSHPTALPYLLLLPSYPPQPILQRLYSDPKYALNPEVRHHLPPKHPYRGLAIGSDDDRREAAWGMLPDPGALRVLHEVGPGDWQLGIPGGESRIAKLVHVLQTWSGDEESYERGLDLLVTHVPDGEPTNSFTAYMARTLPALFVRSRLNGSNRDLEVPDEYKHLVLMALLDVPPIIDGLQTASTVAGLAHPYLPLEPFTKLFDLTTTTDAMSDHQGASDLVDYPHTENRAVARFTQSLDQRSLPNGYVHTLTPSQILSAIAPDLLASLSTAREPPLGIGPTKTTANASITASASAFAGKVYSSHEFRTRETSGSSTLPVAPPDAAAAGVTGVGGTGGLGVNTLKSSRPASRHVDEYAR